MTRKTVLSVVFLSVTGVAVSWEVAAVVNPHDDLVPWTDLIAAYIPPEIAWAAILLLISWLPGHFVHAYAQRGKVMDTVTVPATPAPGAEKEPLLSRAAITAVVSAALFVAVAFGLPITEEQKAAIIGLISVAAPLFLAAWARKKAWAPATVRAAVVEAASSGVLLTEPMVVPSEKADPL